MGDIQKPGQVRSLEWLAAESACREILQSKIDCTDFSGGEDMTTIGKVYSQDVEYTFGPKAVSKGATIVGREALVAHYQEFYSHLRERKYRHLLTNIQFQLIDATHAKSRSTLTTYRLSRPEPMLTDCIQEMHDEFVLEDDGAWRLSKRHTDDLARRGSSDSIVEF